MNFNKYKITISGIVFGVLFWIIEAIFHTLVFYSEGDLIQHLFFIDAHELWMRTLVILFIEALSVYSQIIFNKVKTNEQKLRESEEKYRDLVNLLPQVICETDVHGNLTFVNQNAYKVFGYTQNDFNKGLNALKMIVPKDRERVLRNIKKVLNGEDIDDIEYMALRKDGSVFPFIAYASPIIQENKSVGLRIVLIDASDLKKIEEELGESEEKYRLISENANEMIQIFNEKYEFEYVNEQAFLKFLGYLKDDLIGKSGLEFIHPADSKRAIKELREGFKRGKGSIELRIRHKNGTYRWFEVRGTLYIDKNKKKKALLIGRDVTDKKIAEKKIRESEEKYRLISENANDLVAILNNRFEHEYINEKAYQKILGYSNEDMLGKTRHDIIHPADTKKAFKVLREGFKKGEGTGELRLRHKNGNYIWVETKGTTFKGSDVQLKAITVSRDITERKKAEQKFKESEEKYRELFNNIDSGVAIYEAINNGEDFIFKEFNFAGEKIENISKEDLIGKRVTEVFPGIKDFGLFDVFQRVWKTGKPEHYPIAHYEDKRIEGWRENYVYKLPSGEIVTVYSDLTEKKKAEQKLKESEEKLRYFFNNAQVGLFWSRINDGQFLECNDTFAKLVGYDTREECLAEYVALEHYVDLNTRNEMLEEIRINNEVKDFEIQVTKRDGTPYWASISARTNLKENRIEGAAIDVTKRKKAEQLIKRRLEVARNISTISSRFVGVLNIDDAINASLADMGRLSEASRSYLFLFTEDKTMSNTNEWCDEGVSPQIDNLQDLPFDMLPWWMKQLESGEHIHIVDVSKMPTEASVEKEIFESQDINSLLVLPLYIGKKLSGFLGFDNVKEIREWREEDFVLLSIYSEIIGNAFERKQTDQKLKESEEKYRDLANLLPQNICETDERGNLTFVNDNAFRTFGYTRDDFNRGLNAIQMLIPGDRKRALKNFIKILKREKPNKNEYIALRKDGSTFPVLLYSSPIIVKNKSIGIRAILIDITERKEAEQKLKKSEVKYRHLFETSPYFIGLLNTEGVLIDYNNAINDILSIHTIEDLKGKDFKEIFLLNEENKHLIPIFEKLIKSIFEGVEQEGFDFRLSRAIGGHLWIHIEGTLIEIENQKLIQFIMQDITKRKKAEKALKESETRFKRIFESKMIGVFFWDANGDITDANNVALEMVGYSKDEVLSGAVRWRDLTPPEYTDLDNKALEEIATTGVMTPIEKEYIRKDGSRFPILVGGSVLSGSILRGVSFVLDITERKKGEQIIKNLLEKLRRINIELEQFTYIASHDLKEPLRMVSSFAQLLEKRYKDKLDEDANDFIRFITEGVVRMQDLINSLLSYSRIRKNYNEFDKIDLNNVLKDVLDNLRQVINETNAEIIYDSLPSLVGDKYQLLQVFQNLISNAIKFHGVDPPLIHISSRPDSKYWVFSIRDNGIGIDPKDFERIFIIFQRLHAKDEFDGTGIGLTICKKIIEQYGGKIWVESEVGKGSTFCFLIPKEIDIKS